LRFKLLLTAIILVSSHTLFGATIDLPVQQLDAISPPPNDRIADHGVRLLVQFNLPDSLADKRLIYAELSTPMQLPQFRDTIFSIDVFPIETPWDEDHITWLFPWQNPGGDIDTLNAFKRFFTIGSSDSLNLDLTELTRGWVHEGLPNCGCAIIFYHINQRAPRFNIDNLLPTLRSYLRLRIVFDNGPIAH